MHLLIRRTKDHYEGRIDLTNVVAGNKTVADIISLWDLKLPYLEFKRRLRSIAELSHAQNFESVIPWSDSSAVSKLPEGAWVLPIDEDDWLHPDFVKLFKVTRVWVRARFLTWGVLRKEADGGGPKDPQGYVESCGYALRIPASWPLVTNHRQISEQSIRLTQHLKPVLAVRNETPASIGYMMKQGSPRNAIETSVRNRAFDQKRLYLWTKPQADAYYNLLEEALG